MLLLNFSPICVKSYAFFYFQLKKELGNFGPEFFEEIEDLKYNYKQSVQRNVLLEEKIHQVERQFGISIDID